MSQSAVPHSTLEAGGQRLHTQVNKDAVRAPALTDAGIERLNRVHRMETLANSAVCWPMDEVREILAPQDGVTPRVLSVNSGGGKWPVEMARQFPHAEVLGIDRDPYRPSDAPLNCRFEVFDMESNDITHLEGMFDVVHCARGGGQWIRYYKPFWARLAKLVKPGGLLLYSTGEMVVYDENKNLMKPAEVGQEPGTGSWWARFGVELKEYNPLSLDVSITGPISQNALNWLQSDPNLEKVKENRVYLPIGWLGTSEDNLPNGEELGRLVGTSAIEWGRYMAPTLLANGMPAEVLDLCMREYEAEILEQRVKSYVQWNFFAARGRA